MNINWPDHVAEMVDAHQASRRERGENYPTLPYGTNKSYRIQAEYQSGNAAYAAMNGDLTYRHLLQEALYTSLAQTDDQKLIAALLELVSVSHDFLETLVQKVSTQNA